jgi:hypothetical protein
VSSTFTPLLWPVPRRCPVDDAPHTTCTSPDYVGTKRIVVVQLPQRDELLAAARPLIGVPPVVTLQPGEFTTATYRRRKGHR